MRLETYEGPVCVSLRFNRDELNAVYKYQVPFIVIYYNVQNYIKVS